MLGICGGAMLLGDHVHDHDGVEGGRPTSTSGLGLLHLTTTYDRRKLLRHGTARFTGDLPSPWRSLAGRTVGTTYEIRHGRIETATAKPALHDGLGWADGNVLAATSHGLLEDPTVVAALFDVPPPPSLDAILDELAAAVVPHLDTDAILTSIGA